MISCNVTALLRNPVPWAAIFFAGVEFNLTIDPVLQRFELLASNERGLNVQKSMGITLQVKTLYCQSYKIFAKVS